MLSATLEGRTKDVISAYFGRNMRQNDELIEYLVKKVVMTITIALYSLYWKA